MDVCVSEHPEVDVAASMAELLAEAVHRRGEAYLALSGGSTAPPMIAALVGHDLPWELIGVWQVDERVAPDGHPERNAEQLAAIPGRVHLMPVTDADLDTAAEHYAANLPDRFDVIHLGLGPDGHTASWPPGHPVVDSELAVVAIGEFNGFRRMTLTPRVVNAARSRLMFTTGADKRDVVTRWLDGDPSLPASRLERADTSVFLDPAAAPSSPE